MLNCLALALWWLHVSFRSYLKGTQVYILEGDEPIHAFVIWGTMKQRLSRDLKIVLLINASEVSVKCPFRNLLLQREPDVMQSKKGMSWLMKLPTAPLESRLN